MGIGRGREESTPQQPVPENWAPISKYVKIATGTVNTVLSART